ASLPPPPPARPTGHGPGLPPPPGAHAERPVHRHRGRVLVAVVVAFTLVAGSVGVWLLRGDGDDSAERGRDGDGRVDAPAGPETEAPPTPEELRAVVDEISVFVEEERGLEFIEPVDVELADDDEFRERLLADFDDDVDSLREMGM